MNNAYTPGKCEWYFPDAFLPDISDGISHEAICVLNLGQSGAHIELTLYFEDSEPLSGFSVLCGAGRTEHIRLDRIRSGNGISIPQCRPYAVRLCSDQPVLCQYTRVDAERPGGLMTTMGL